MSVYKRGNTWWFNFIYDGRRIQEKTEARKKPLRGKWSVSVERN